MKKTGYVVVDCSGVNFLSTEKVVHAGMYDRVKAAFDTGKPMFAVGGEYGEGVPMTPVQLMAILEAGVYIMTASILQIRVNSDDQVWMVPLIES